LYILCKGADVAFANSQNFNGVVHQTHDTRRFRDNRPAVHNQIGSGDPARSVTCQVNAGVRYVFRFAHPPDAGR